jgi:predicted amidophosphoribosyltransferase
MALARVYRFIICVKGVGVDECWALDLHSPGGVRTEIGELVHRAKTYTQGEPGELDAAHRLGEELAWWAPRIPRSRIVDASAVCAVPANPRKVPFNLPDALAPFVADALGVPCRLDLVRKVRKTPQVKYDGSKAEKVSALGGAFETTDSLHGQTVVVVDDLVDSGATLEAVAAALRARAAPAE